VLKQFVLGAALLTGLSAAVSAQDAPKPNDYSDPKAWLCRPGAHDACDIDETATVVAANGTLTRETWKADPNAPIDCFYVYPTVSTDPGQNSDMTPDPAEINVVKQQFARFASTCRPYAPACARRWPRPAPRWPGTRASSTTMCATRGITT